MASLRLSRRLPRLYAHSSRFLSSTTPAEEKTHAQPFVQARIQAGEWDAARTNPLYRPRFRSRARILSEEDFRNRPRVGFSGEFESFQDAMVTLSWMNDSEQKQIYQLYLELQNHAQEKHGVTSHEYSCRVIAQKYSLSMERVAGIVQLQHNEEQYRRDPSRPLLEEAAAYMDRAIQQEILDAYQTFGLKKPDDFVEDPTAVIGAQESKQWQVLDDLLDADQLLNDASVREERQGRLIIDGHVYLEDIDDEQVQAPLSKDARNLLQQHAQNQKSAPPPSKIEWPDKGQDKRPRWKYVAQIVNTRQLKKERSKHRSYTNNNPVNTLVECDGTLRPATVRDVATTSWKATRNVQEHAYGEAKKGWLNRTLRGQADAWGKAPPMAQRAAGEAAAAAAKTEEEETDETTDEEGTAEDDPGSSDSSSDESDGSSDGESEDDKDGDDSDDKK